MHNLCGKNAKSEKGSRLTRDGISRWSATFDQSLQRMRFDLRPLQNNPAALLRCGGLGAGGLRGDPHDATPI